MTGTLHHPTKRTALLVPVVRMTKEVGRMTMPLTTRPLLRHRTLRSVTGDIIAVGTGAIRTLLLTVPVAHLNATQELAARLKTPSMRSRSFRKDSIVMVDP